MATTQPTIEDGCYYCGQSLRSIIARILRHLRDVQQSNDPRLLDKEKGCFPKLYNALGRKFSERLPLALYIPRQITYLVIPLDSSSERLPLAVYLAVKDYL